MKKSISTLLCFPLLVLLFCLSPAQLGLVAAETNERDSADISTLFEELRNRQRIAMPSAEEKAKRIKQREEEKKEAEKLLDCAVGLGNPVAQYKKALLYCCASNYNEAAQLMLKAARAGVVPAQYEVGGMYLTGQGVEKSNSEAYKWFLKAADVGYVQGRGILTKSPLLAIATAHLEGGIGKEDYPEAFNWFEKFSLRQYDVDVNHAWLHNFTFQGTNVLKQTNSVAELKRRAENGDRNAQYDYADCVRRQPTEDKEFYQQIFGEKNAKDDEVIKWLSKSAEAGCVPAMYDLASYMVQKDPDTSFRWFVSAAEKNYAPAQYALGRIYGDGGPWWSRRDDLKDFKQAVKWYRRAIENGHLRAPAELAILLYQNDGKEVRDDIEITKLFGVAAKLGHADAQNLLGKAYETGRGVKKNVEEAFKWYQKAALQDVSSSYAAPASMSLGRLFFHGKGTERDRKKAAGWFMLAAYNHSGMSVGKSLFSDQWFMSDMPKDSGGSGSYLYIGIMMEEGVEVKKDVEQAKKCYAKALSGSPANVTLSEAYYLLGLSHIAAGESVPALVDMSLIQRFQDNDFVLNSKRIFGCISDPYIAFECFKKADEYNNAPAKYMIGKMYLHGIAVQTNTYEALKWLNSSADAGLANAQLCLAGILEKGEVTEKDLPKAFTLYKKVADQGNVDGMFHVGRCYALGIGTPKSSIDAYAYFNVAAASGDESSQKNRAIVEKEMNSLQIAEAQERSKRLPTVKQSQESSGSTTDAKEELKTGGTGFFISEDGYLITAAHVVEKASKVKIIANDFTGEAKVIKIDQPNDIAVLKVEGKFLALPLIKSQAARMGDTVFTLGFPNVRIQGVLPKLSKGEISSLSGIKDDLRHFQISAPVQPGNSGGALFDANGNVIGMVIARLDDATMVKATGTVPQNVNYAIKSSYLLATLESVPDLLSKLKTDQNEKPKQLSDIAEKSQKGVALVLCY